jgi:hypothetical protein
VQLGVKKLTSEFELAPVILRCLPQLWLCRQLLPLQPELPFGFAAAADA